MDTIDMILNGSIDRAISLLDRLPITIWIVCAVLFVLGFYVMAAVHDPKTLGGISTHFSTFIRSVNLITPSFESKVLDSIPVPIWVKAPDNEILYANKCYKETVPDISIPAFSTSTADAHGRHSIIVENQPHWFEISTAETAESTLGIALPADKLVNTEATLKRFIETLSTTFAHLSSGLAIFNADKTLHLFNPALSSLLNLDPTWLAMRPSIATFLEKLRENRQLPEQKNFLEWRRILLELQGQGDTKCYKDQWFLPDGRVLQVTAQPHSQGAIAYMFEDITAQIAIERQRRAEIAVNQAVLDKISDAVVILDPSGAVSFANAAFDDAFGIESTGTLLTPSIDTISRAFPNTRNSAEFWDHLRMYISRTSSTEAWAANLITHNNTSLHVDISPTPDGSTLAIFKKETGVLHSLPITQKLAAAYS